MNQQRVIKFWKFSKAIVDSRLHSQCCTLTNYQPNTVVVWRRSTGTATWILMNSSIIMSSCLILAYGPMLWKNDVIHKTKELYWGYCHGVVWGWGWITFFSVHAAL